MAISRTLPAGLAALAALACALGANAAAGARSHARAAAAPAALRRSLNLWATIDVCSPGDQPDTVGIRGSMPGDKAAGDDIYMRFRLQYAGANGRTWLNLAGSSGFIRVGSAKAARQDGWSFLLTPVSGRPATTLRGVVTFQWRRGATVLAAISRATTAGHESLAGGDPPNYSAATCIIG
jgi:hypothetical protein